MLAKGKENTYLTIERGEEVPRIMTSATIVKAKVIGPTSARMLKLREGEAEAEVKRENEGHQAVKNIKEGKEVKVQAKKVVLLQNLEVQVLKANQRNHI
jgi:allophanate hydrolase subunit 2